MDLNKCFKAEDISRFISDMRAAFSSQIIFNPIEMANFLKFRCKSRYIDYRKGTQERGEASIETVVCEVPIVQLCHAMSGQRDLNRID